MIVINNYWMRLSKISWFVSGEQINCLPKPNKEYLREAKRSAIFTQERSQEGEKGGVIYARTEYYLQPNKVGRHCAWGEHYLLAVICRSRGALSANEKEEKFSTNDNIVWEIFTRQESLFPLIKCKDKSFIHMFSFLSSKDVLLCYPVLRRVLGCKDWNEVWQAWTSQ